MANIEIRRTRPEEFEQVFDLRWRVLRAPLGKDRGTEQDEYDYRMRTIHGGAFVDGKLVSTGRANIVGDRPEQVQVRYMATEEEYRGQGLGRDVLSFIEQQSFVAGAQIVSLNARVEVVDFYKRAGYGPTTEIERLFHGIAHLPMRKALTE